MSSDEERPAGRDAGPAPVAPFGRLARKRGRLSGGAATSQVTKRVVLGERAAQSVRIRLHRRQFVATRVEELEAPAAGETEDRFDDRRTGRGDGSERRL